MSTCRTEGLFIDTNNNNKTLDLLMEVENMESEVCRNIASVFTEILKDEINANDEQRLYNGTKRLIKKYSQEKRGIEALNEFISVLSGGASLEELLLITKEEAKNPTLATELTVDDRCYTEEPTFETQ